MPELPDLEVIRGFLGEHLVGHTITAVEVVRPTVIRNLLDGDFAARLAGRRVTAVRRHGKFLLFDLSAGEHVALNPMLAGRLQYCLPDARRLSRTYLVLALDDGHELRYSDQRSMGKIYLTDDLARVPGFGELGPDALDPALTLEVFKERLRRFRGEIKGVLTRQTFVAGVGNAYADEILWQAGLSPFRKRPQLSDQDVARLYEAMRLVLSEAIATLRQRVGADIHVEIRDFLQVHRRGGESCPRCGTRISEVSARKRITNFCRTCQPGGLIRQ
ncbi:MAG: DNA-formamidopyrimidine glycosylase family protein [Chloroflexota bacterium]|nr:DNA-formamidopyrimidine glycosylase family protein [Chloroflexota bacterium]